jgi:SAM-dependent methyltransferase
LQDRIEAVLRRYRTDSDTYKYFYGQPYQGLALAGVFGDRVCDDRFDDYEFRKFIKPNDRILDIGCNCGFMAILAAYRIGCRAEGIDINKYMTEIGGLVAEHLRIADLVKLHAGKLQEYRPDEPFDVVLSFATHWTDDENYRVGLDEHMQRMASYLRPGGTLMFESHMADVGKPEFYAAMDAAKSTLHFDGIYKMVDSGQREFYIMTRRD